MHRILVDCCLTGSLFSCQPVFAYTLADLRDQVRKPSMIYGCRISSRETSNRAGWVIMWSFLGRRILW